MRGLRVIIAGAGMSAALPGVAAAHTDLPVIGVPLMGDSLADSTLCFRPFSFRRAYRSPASPSTARGTPASSPPASSIRDPSPPPTTRTEKMIERYTRDEIGVGLDPAGEDGRLAQGRTCGDRRLGGRGRGARRSGSSLPGARRFHGRGRKRTRAGDQPRRRRFHRRSRRVNRRRRPLDPLWPDLLGRARHRPG